MSSSSVDGALLRLENDVAQWLSNSRLERVTWPTFIFREVAALGPNPDSRPVFTQPTVAIQAGPPGGPVRIRWDLADAEALVDEFLPQATISITPDVYARTDFFLRTMMVVVLLFAMRRRGRFHVHAAALQSPEGEGWLLAGSSGGGKSTTTALLAREGWRVSTEDIAFIEPALEGAVGVRGFRTRLALRPGGASLLQIDAGLALADRGKIGLWPEELGASWIPVIVPTVIMFTSVGNDRTVVERLSSMDAMRGLVQWSMWVLFETIGATEHLRLLSGLSAQTRAYRVQLGRDVFDRPALLQDAVA
ncbi:MAG TPA: hypothetical protein VHE78_07170 [Gemmatimonadaceae bacterium]|nr:hypothetical protein [Gemmatimonadaceae bacterium]